MAWLAGTGLGSGTTGKPQRALAWWGFINDVLYYLDGGVGIGEVGPEHWGSPGLKSLIRKS